MTCTSPQYFNGAICPCGVCMACRVHKTQEWSLRLLHESSNHEKASFVTLTYEDSKLPANGSLIKPDFQNFMKRLRKEVSDKIKYFACGEYGEQFSRPHYHAIIFGANPDKQLFESVWPYGFTVALPYIGLPTGNYVAGYVQKKLYGKTAVEYRKANKLAPFALMSKGLGATYLQDYGEQIKKDLFLRRNGYKVGIPRYYRKKLGIEVTDYEERILQRKDEVFNFHFQNLEPSQFHGLTQEQLDGLIWLRVHESIKRSRLQRALETKWQCAKIKRSLH